MPPEADKLFQQRAGLIDQARKILDKAGAEKRDLTAEEDAEFTRLHTEANTLRDKANQIVAQHQREQERKRRQDEAEASLDALNTHGIDLSRHRGSTAAASPRERPRDQDWNVAVAGWFLNQSDYGHELTDQHVQAAQRVGLNLQARVLSLPLNHDFRAVKRDFRNALSTQTAGGGAVLVPETLLSTLEMAMLQFGGMLQVSEIIRTNGAGPMQWPTANDTGNTGRQIGEGRAVTATDPSFAAKTWNAYKFSSDEVLVSYELLRDSPINLVQAIGAMLGERLGRIQNTKFTTGTGASTATGIVTAATVGKTAASATAITADELIDLQHSVNPAYRNGPGVGWMFHDNVALALRKLKDGNSRYYWQDSLQNGQPERLFNAPVTINNDMASSIATTAKTVLFGDFSYYKIRQVGAVRIYRLTERYRENDQDAFLAFVEADGNLLDAGTHPVKVLQQA